MKYYLLLVVFLFEMILCFGQRPNHNTEVEVALHKTSFCLNYWTFAVGREVRIENSNHENIDLCLYEPASPKMPQSTGINLNKVPAGDYKLIITYKSYEGESVRNGFHNDFELISNLNIVLKTFLTFDELGNISESFCANGNYYYLLSDPLKVIIFFEIR